MRQSWLECLVLGLAQGWAEWHHNASGPECCAYFAAVYHQDSAAVEGSCVLLIQMHNAQQHHMHQPLARLGGSLHGSNLQTADILVVMHCTRLYNT